MVTIAVQYDSPPALPNDNIRFAASTPDYHYCKYRRYQGPEVVGRMLLLCWATPTDTNAAENLHSRFERWLKELVKFLGFFNRASRKKLLGCSCAWYQSTSRHLTK
ncbi:hypothetical protein M413DRAFT_440820 [Hebeloma cylindrosporum]|uniref:Uncharacterized protein n=1 Tax=Hebeloma cylindrosporum TaxID=76867 RepID=A0A0C2YXV1_HEBCY|nr:hypothetical protein M413DRAFT_440820 [Hebeloma cylindrosporum h7]